jgi:antitoxin HicB
MRFAWPVEVLEEPEGITVTCPDVPELVTCGGTLPDALDSAIDALVSALSFYTDEGRKLPSPSPSRGRHVVTVPALIAAKLALHEAMVAAGISNTELGRRLGTDEKAIRRLRDPLHGSKIERVEAALRELGRRLEVVVTAAAD